MDQEDKGLPEKVISCHRTTLDETRLPKRTISKTGEKGSLKFIIRTIKGTSYKKNINQIKQTETVQSSCHKRHKGISRLTEHTVSNANDSEVIAEGKSKKRNCQQFAQSRKMNKRKLKVSRESFDRFGSTMKATKKGKYKHAHRSTKARRVFKAFERCPHSTKLKMKSEWTVVNDAGDERTTAGEQTEHVTKASSVRESLKQTAQVTKPPKNTKKNSKQVKFREVNSNQRKPKSDKENLKDVSQCETTKGRKKRQRGLPLLYSCAQCQTVFKERSVLNIHLRTIHSDIYNLSCKLCTFTAETISAKRKHYLKDHKRVKAFECDYPSCTFNTNRIQRLLKHQSQHPKKGDTDTSHDRATNQMDNDCLLKTFPRSISCKYCGLIFMTMKMLEKHYAEIHVNCRPFQCTVQGCGYNATRMRILQIHIKKHAKEEEHLQKADKSQKSSKHGGSGGIGKTLIPQYSQHCPKCEAKFIRQADLTRHIQRIHEGSSHLRCRFCNISTESVKQLQHHCDEVHDTSYPFKCNFTDCKYISRRFHELKKHRFRMHSQTKEFVCESCGASFKNMHDLGNHTRSCLELQEFLCDVCGQTFNHLPSLQTHHRSVHGGLKPFTCPHCGKSFGDRSNLRRHIRIHKNMFPYSCNICGRAFRHSNSLKSHKNTHGDVLT